MAQLVLVKGSQHIVAGYHFVKGIPQEVKNEDTIAVLMGSGCFEKVEKAKPSEKEPIEKDEEETSPAKGKGKGKK